MAVVVVIVGGLILHLTRFGRHTYVIGSNAEAARRSGINVDRHLIKLYALSGSLAGFAGMMSLIRFTTTTVGGHGTDSLVVITGVALGGISLFGGIGLMVGTVIGMFIPTVLNNGLVSTNVSAFWQQIAIGLILIGAVYLDQLKRSRRNQPQLGPPFAKCSATVVGWPRQFPALLALEHAVHPPSRKSLREEPSPMFTARKSHRRSERQSPPR